MVASKVGRLATRGLSGNSDERRGETRAVEFHDDAENVCPLIPVLAFRLVVDPEAVVDVVRGPLEVGEERVGARAGEHAEITLLPATALGACERIEGDLLGSAAELEVAGRLLLRRAIS